MVHEPRSAHPSPWGPIQSVDVIGNGIVSVDCAGHGGLWLSADRLADMPEDCLSSDGWYERDVEALWVFKHLERHLNEPLSVDARAMLDEALAKERPEGFAAHTLQRPCERDGDATRLEAAGRLREARRQGEANVEARKRMNALNEVASKINALIQPITGKTFAASVVDGEDGPVLAVETLFWSKDQRVELYLEPMPPRRVARAGTARKYRLSDGGETMGRIGKALDLDILHEVSGHGGAWAQAVDRITAMNRIAHADGEFSVITGDEAQLVVNGLMGLGETVVRLEEAAEVIAETLDCRPGRVREDDLDGPAP